MEYEALSRYFLFLVRAYDEMERINICSGFLARFRRTTGKRIFDEN